MSSGASGKKKGGLVKGLNLGSEIKVPRSDPWPSPGGGRSPTKDNSGFTRKKLWRPHLGQGTKAGFSKSGARPRCVSPANTP